MQQAFDSLIHLRSVKDQGIKPSIADTLLDGKKLTVFPFIEHRHQIQPFLYKLHTYAIVNVTLNIMVCKAGKIL